MSVDLSQYITRDFTCNAYKSVNDKKSYRQVRLDNGLQVILIQDISEATEQLSSGRKTLFGASSSSFDPFGSLPRKRFRTVSPMINQDMGEPSGSSEVESVSDDECSEDDRPGADGKSGERSSAMSLCVRVGSLDDPEDLQGLCHYTEHVVLMGNEQFPEVNEFDEYVERHCGYSNGITEYECTYYEAEIPNQYLEGCMQRFAACFKKPLFREEDVERELNPVHNEFVDNFTDDEVRLEHLLCSMARSDHPLNKFSWGNNVSLREQPAANNVNVRERMVEFFEKHYKADAMTLAVQSQQSLDYMEKLVRQHFSDIASLGKQSDGATSPGYELLCQKLQHLPISTKLRKPEGVSFDSTALNHIHYVDPIDEGHFLKMFWFFPPLITSYRAKPLVYIGSLLGHEGVGSLIAYMREQLLALEIVAGNDDHSFDQNTHQSVFSISIQLTDKGLEQLSDVIALVQYYLKMIIDLGPQKWFFEEERLNALSQFRFRNEQPAVKNVADLARNSFVYPFEHVLVGAHLLWDYDQELIGKCLQHIKLENSICFVLSKQAHEQMDGPILTDPWAGIRYKTYKISDRFGEIALPSSHHLKSQIAFPQPNEYITSDFSLHRVESLPTPRLLHEDTSSKLYWLPDLEFDTPKGYVMFQFSSLKRRDSIIAATCLDVYVAMFEKWIRQYTYAASVANIDFEIKITSVGLIFKFNGFSQNLMKLVKMVFEKFMLMPIPETLFDTIRVDLLRTYANISIECTDFIEITNKTAVVEGVYSPLDKRRILYHLEPAQVRRHVDEVMHSSYIQGLVYGNLPEKQACECFIKIRTLISNEENRIEFEKIKRIGVRQVPPGHAQLLYKAFTPSDENVMVNAYCQIGSVTLSEQVLLGLLVHEMQEPLFNMLRTKENLAYMLYPYHECFGHVGAFGIMIRSLVNKFTANHVLERIDAFLAHFAQHVADLPIAKFQQLKQAKLKLLRTPYINMRERCEDVWNEIACFEYRFDIRAIKISLLERIDWVAFKQFAKQVLSTERQRRLTLVSIGHGDNATQTTAPIHPFILTTFDHEMKALRTGIEEDIESYDQVPDEVSPDDIVYSLDYLRPIPTDPYVQYITDLPGFTQLMPFFPETDRATAPESPPFPYQDL
jgi:nardilysin